MAADEVLREVLVLRGGAALRLFYGGVRESRDLDLVVLVAEGADATSAQAEAKRRLNTALNQGLPRRFPGPPRWQEWAAMVKIDLAACTAPIDWRLARIPHAGRDGNDGTIKVCTLEDIVAEKIVAILTGPVMHPPSNREQDLFDLASISSTPADEIDRGRVAELAAAKGACRRCRVSISAFTGEVRDRLMTDYARLRQQTSEAFIPFDSAWTTVLKFVGTLEFAR